MRQTRAKLRAEQAAILVQDSKQSIIEAKRVAREQARKLAEESKDSTGGRLRE